MPTPSRRILVDNSLLAAKAPVKIVGAVVQETAGLLRRDGRLNTGEGIIATVIALTLGFLSLLGVLAFHFPQYLTTPQLRQEYSVDVLRQVLLVTLLIAGGLSIANLLLGRRRNLNAVAFLFVLVAVALGGSRVPVGHFRDHTPYIGLDWFILDLLGSTVVFVVLEKLAPLYAGQPVFLDYLFGSAVKVPAHKPFPAKYGVVGDYMPDGFVKQQMFPFRAEAVLQAQD